VDLLRRRQRAEFRFIGEFVRRAGAVQEADIVVRNRERMAHHRPQRSDAGPAGNKYESLFRGIVGKCERTYRTFHIDPRARFQSEMVPWLSVALDPDEQLENAFPFRILRRGGD